MAQNKIKGELSIEQYRAAMETLPLPTVDVVLFNAEKSEVLLGKRVKEPYAEMFCTFGGRLYKNEEFADEACRIIKKETGLSLSPSEITFAGVINEINDVSLFEGVSYHSVDIYFGCVIEEQAITIDDQHSEARWLPVEYPTLPPHVRARINGALRAL